MWWRAVGYASCREDPKPFVWGLTTSSGFTDTTSPVANSAISYFQIYVRIERSWVQYKCRPHTAMLDWRLCPFIFCFCAFFSWRYSTVVQPDVTAVYMCLSLPSWASKDVVWSNMLEKDKAYTRDVHMMEKHPHLQPKMRAILLDWLMEVRAPGFSSSVDAYLKCDQGDARPTYYLSSPAACNVCESVT